MSAPGAGEAKSWQVQLGGPAGGLISGSPASESSRAGGEEGRREGRGNYVETIGAKLPHAQS